MTSVAGLQKLVTLIREVVENLVVVHPSEDVVSHCDLASFYSPILATDQVLDRSELVSYDLDEEHSVDLVYRSSFETVVDHDVAHSTYLEVRESAEEVDRPFEVALVLPSEAVVGAVVDGP